MNILNIETKPNPQMNTVNQVIIEPATTTDCSDDKRHPSPIEVRNNVRKRQTLELGGGVRNADIGMQYYTGPLKDANTVSGPYQADTRIVPLQVMLKTPNGGMPIYLEPARYTRNSDLDSQINSSQSYRKPNSTNDQKVFSPKLKPSPLHKIT